MRRLALSLVLVAGCGSRAARHPPAPTLGLAQLHDDKALSRAELSELVRAPRADYRQELTIAVRDDVAGRGFEGRGVVAVRPGVALRMILLGPGGSTAMDVWIREGKFRVAIPALDRVVRGDGSSDPKTMRGLPVPLLWRWLVRPFGGTLVAARREERGFVAFMLREGTFEIRARTDLASRGWWFSHGRLVAWLEGEERVLGDSIVANDVTWVSLDPPMTVRVHGTQLALAPDLPAATFVDPDAQ